VADDTVVGAALERDRARDRSPRRAAVAPGGGVPAAGHRVVGLPPLEPTPQGLRAADSAMRERMPLDAIAAAPWPKLVTSGAWDSAPAAYREVAAAPLTA
jgi:hypothetical protein